MERIKHKGQWYILDTKQELLKSDEIMYSESVEWEDDRLLLKLVKFEEAYWLDVYDKTTSKKEVWDNSRYLKDVVAHGILHANIKWSAPPDVNDDVIEDFLKLINKTYGWL
jgi:hypothetical protein